MLSKLSAPLLNIITEYFTLEELIHWAANQDAPTPFLYDPKKNRKHKTRERRAFFEAVNTQLEIFAEFLKSSHTYILLKPYDEQTHITLARIIQILQDKKKSLLNNNHIHKSLKIKLRAADPFFESHSVRELLTLDDLLLPFILDRIRFQSEYKKLYSLLSRSSESQVSGLRALYRLFEDTYLGWYLSREQMAAMLAQYLNQNNITILGGNWDSNLNNNSDTTVTTLWSEFRLYILFKALLKTKVTHLGLLFYTFDDPLSSLSSLFELLSQTNITHLDIGKVKEWEYEDLETLFEILRPVLETKKLQSVTVSHETKTFSIFPPESVNPEIVSELQPSEITHLSFSARASSLHSSSSSSSVFSSSLMQVSSALASLSLSPEESSSSDSDRDSITSASRSLTFSAPSSSTRIMPPPPSLIPHPSSQKSCSLIETFRKRCRKK